MQTVLCKANIHAWGSWQKPHWHSGAWFQSHVCDRCGKIETRAALNYRPPEDDMQAIADLIDHLELPGADRPLDVTNTTRAPFDLGTIDARLAGESVHVWIGSDPAEIVGHVNASAEWIKGLTTGEQRMRWASIAVDWCCKMWCCTPAHVAALYLALGPFAFMKVVTGTSGLALDHWRTQVEAAQLAGTLGRVAIA